MTETAPAPPDSYLDRFPPAHRSDADRAYQDGFSDALGGSDAGAVAEAARNLLAAFGGDVPAGLRAEAEALESALSGVPNARDLGVPDLLTAADGLWQSLESDDDGDWIVYGHREDSVLQFQAALTVAKGEPLAALSPAMRAACDPAGYTVEESEADGVWSETTWSAMAPDGTVIESGLESAAEAWDAAGAHLLARGEPIMSDQQPESGVINDSRDPGSQPGTPGDPNALHSNPEPDSTEGAERPGVDGNDGGDGDPAPGTAGV